MQTQVWFFLTFKQQIQNVIKQFSRKEAALIKTKIREVLHTTPIWKFNTMLCGEFIKQLQDMWATDFKYLKTRNSRIDGNTDLEEWFAENVIDTLGVKDGSAKDQKQEASRGRWWEVPEEEER